MSATSNYDEEAAGVLTTCKYHVRTVGYLSRYGRKITPRITRGPVCYDEEYLTEEETAADDEEMLGDSVARR